MATYPSDATPQTQLSGVTPEPGLPDVSRGRPTTRATLLGGLIVAILSAAYTLLYWNRFLGVSAGGTFLYFAEQLLNGHMLYRDVLSVITPLHTLKLTALVWLFGDFLIVDRVEGLVQRILLGVMMYALLVRFCRVRSAVLAAFAALVLASADEADALGNYHIDSAFWAIAATLAANVYVSARSLRRKTWAAAGTGFLCALSVLTKQTTGAGITVALAFVGLLLAWKGIGSSIEERKAGAGAAARFLTAFAAGWLLPMATFTAWLWRVDALGPFLKTVFTASTSKGHPLAVFSRPFFQIPALFFSSAFFSLALSWLVRRGRLRSESQDSLWKTAVMGVLAALAVAVAVGIVYSGSPQPPNTPGPLRFSPFFGYIVFEMSLAGCGIVFLMLGWRFLRRRLTESEARIWLLSACGFSVAYMLSLSWSIYAPMAAPSVALVMGLALDRRERSGAPSFAVLTLLTLFLIWNATGYKLSLPFAWMYWPEPSVQQSRSTSSFPKLAGLRISEPTLSLTENITNLVKTHTKPGDTLLVYPYFPLFYSLTELDPPTYTFNHYIDVCPDVICKQDAETIRRRPPDAIVYMVEDLETLQSAEAIFRSGGVSGSREVVRAIEDVARGYRKLLSTKIPGSPRVIEVYVKQ